MAALAKLAELGLDHPRARPPAARDPAWSRAAAVRRASPHARAAAASPARARSSRFAPSGPDRHGRRGDPRRGQRFTSPSSGGASSTRSALSKSATTTRSSASARARTARPSSAPTTSSRRPSTPTVISVSASARSRSAWRWFFTRLTIAHDILSDREKRTEYDAYLGEQRISRSIEENLARGVAEAKRAEEAIAAAVRAEEMGRLPSPTPAASPAPKPTPMPTPTPSPTLDVDLQARKNALARRLLGGARPPSAATNPAPSGPPQGMSTADAVASLKRRYEERLLRARASESRKFAGQGETAAAAGDHVTAANMLRIAANLAPDDASLQTRSKMASEKADVLLRETYTKQAQFITSYTSNRLK